MTELPIICVSCKNYFPRKGTCRAFPKGVPEDIQLEGGDHRQPREGDHGIQYEQKPGAQETFKQWASFNRAREGK